MFPASIIILDLVLVIGRVDHHKAGIKGRAIHWSL